MIKIRLTFCALTLFFSQQILDARPLLTEEVPTIGKKAFEASISPSRRIDSFGSPENAYKTVNFPLSTRIGVHRHADIGFYLSYLSQRLETQNSHFAGSQNGRFSPFIKVSPWDNLGFQLIYHQKRAEQNVQNLPIARGDDFELITLLQLPVTWPVSVNVGYLFRGDYHSKFGVSNDIAYKVEPGDIFETKGSVEIPLKYHLSLLGELAYYSSKATKIQGISVPDSSAEAMDGLIGVTWAHKGWNIGLGTAFGLLDEKHTSFDIERGAGDVTYRAGVSYRLVPRRPEQ